MRGEESQYYTKILELHEEIQNSHNRCTETQQYTREAGYPSEAQFRLVQ